MKKRIIGLISFIIFAFLIANIPSPKKSSNVNQGVLSTENQDKTEKISPSPILSDSLLELLFLQKI